MITIYHNPRCSKSRDGLQLLELEQQPFTVVKYLDQPLTKPELIDLLKKLGIAPLELVRQNEAIWKEHFKGRPMFDDEILEALLRYPQLIERPIVVKGDKAVIARLADRIREVL